MAPTICFSEKTVLGVELRNGRRLRKMGVALANAKAAGVAQNSAVLRYAANGSVNSTGRWKRRRGVRMTPRLPQNARRVALGSTSAANGHVAEIISEQTKHLKRMELNYNKMRSQLVRTHSSSSSSNNKQFNIKTVLQPTTANNNCCNSNCSGCGNNKTATAKFCDHSSYMDEDDDNYEEKDRDYVFVREPIMQQQMQQEQQIPKYHPQNGLLSIALKTINLVQRNEILQNRLNQLQLETSKFIASVLANPENRHFREGISTNIESNVLRH
ncbi:uncharacterized protein Cipc isoform X2 [Drosophila virilis]|uniref:Uncharacterized protein n=3 Tax=Drosophila virilis TaxID=7244 RepID=B4LYT8_DROVI|nr:uncharacterized protein LOC6630993 [Drosophila virilis]EDW67015.2 uncharacterized protein Dvir_GJ23916 [Drosophila virilis]